MPKKIKAKDMSDRALCSKDLMWVAQYYLGRPLSVDDNVVNFESDGIRSALYNSDERKARGHVSYRADEFCSWKKDRPRIVVLSSCQGAALARAIAGIASVSVYGTAVVKTKDPAVSAHLLSMMEAADFVLTASFTEGWGDFYEPKLRERFGDKLLTYNRPFFEGIHPDLCYVHPSAPRVPTGSYHSRLVIDSFLKGLSVNECIARFNCKEYERIGFRDISEKAFSKLVAKDKIVDIKIHDIIKENYRKKPLFYTVNHPTSYFSTLVARDFLSRVGIETLDVDAELIPSVLISNVVWPVDAGISNLLGLEFNTDSIYWYNYHSFSLEEFAWRSYQAYEGVNPALLAGGVESLRN